MKNYLVKARINFDDVEEKNEYGCNTKRKANESTWYCTKERYEFLKSHNAVVLMGIDEIKEEPKSAEEIDFNNGIETMKARMEETKTEDETKVEIVKPKRTRKKRIVE